MRKILLGLIMAMGAQVVAAEDAAKAREANVAKADEKAQNLKFVFDRMNPEGDLSMSALARQLNDEGIPTPSSKGKWQAVTVSRILKRL